MKLLRSFSLAALSAVTVTGLISGDSVKASTFDETPLDQSKVVAVARPYGDNKYDLFVIEQIPEKQACWNESGANPVLIEPLLLNFDFTGICRRATDSNGYSIRIDGKDYGLDYMLRLVERNGELVLVGTNRMNPSQEIIVGRTRGLSSGFLKIQLEAGWQFSKRTYQGTVLGHFYFSGRQAGMGVSEAVPTTTDNEESSTVPTSQPSL